MTDDRPKLILASRSPRRRQLLAEAGYPFDVIVPAETAECGICSSETPPELVARLAHQKAGDVARRIDEGLVIGADTVVECAGQILGKPEDENHARRMLRWLRGRVHRVHSGICLWRRPGDVVLVKAEVTQLRMDEVDDGQLEAYITTGAWEGKAGAFGYQDRLGWIRLIKGSQSNVVGLPLELLEEMMRQFRAS